MKPFSKALQLVVLAWLGAAATCLAATPQAPSSHAKEVRPSASAVFAPGTISKVQLIIRRTYGPPCKIEPRTLHALANFAWGKWLLRKEEPACVHITKGQRVTVELDSGQTVTLEQLGMQGVKVGQRIWLDESLWATKPMHP